MIFEGQDHIHQAINGINKRVMELLGLSEKLSHQITQLPAPAPAVRIPLGLFVR